MLPASEINPEFQMTSDDLVTYIEPIYKTYSDIQYKL